MNCIKIGFPGKTDSQREKVFGKSYSLENSLRESIFREDLFLYNCLQPPLPPLPTPPTAEPCLRLQREEEEEEEIQLPEMECDQLTRSGRMPEYAREYFDQQQEHQHVEQIVEPPYQVSHCMTEDRYAS